MYNKPLLEVSIQLIEKDEEYPIFGHIARMSSLVMKADETGLYNIILKNRYGIDGVIQKPVSWDTVDTEYAKYSAGLIEPLTFREWVKIYYSPSKI